MNLTLKRALVDSARCEATQMSCHWTAARCIRCPHMFMLASVGPTDAGTLHMPLACVLRSLCRGFSAAPPLFLHFALHGRYQATHTTATGRNLAHITVNAARMLQINGESDAALPLLFRSLQALESLADVPPADLIVSRTNIASCLHSLGRYDEALPQLQQQSELCKQVLGASDPYTLTSIINVAACLTTLNRHSEALSVLQDVLELCEVALPAGHVLMLQCLMFISQTLQAMQRYDEALPVGQRVLEARTAAVGAAHPNTLRSVDLHATCLRKMGRYDEALPYSAMRWKPGIMFWGQHTR